MGSRRTRGDRKKEEKHGKLKGSKNVNMKKWFYEQKVQSRLDQYD